MGLVRRRVVIPGPVLLGFAKFFDRSYGDPKTKRPYPKVIPSHIGGVLLPWNCPHCGLVRPNMADAKKRAGYTDKIRGFSWCPACRGRYIVDERGADLVGALPKGAKAAPALVERAGKVEKLRPVEPPALDLLGAL